MKAIKELTSLQTLILHYGFVRRARRPYLDFSEVIRPQLDERSCGEHPQGRHNQGTVLQAVEVGHHQQEVVSLLHGQETRPRYVDA